MSGIRRDFLPPDLMSVLHVARLDGTIAVQARQSLAETEWLLNLCRLFPYIRGVVGWVPLAEQGESVGSLLDRYGTHPRFKGVRHVLQAEPDAYFENARFNEALQEVAHCGLTYDLLIFSRQLPAATAWVDRHPSLRIVLDHIAKPLVSGPPPQAWREGIRELARRPHVFCKFSGIVTETPGWRWTTDLVRPYFEVVLEAFGPERMMFGSDWPVCLLAGGYEPWLEAVEELLQSLAGSERDAIMGGTATAAYQLNSWSPAP